jgi:hypothetical protein
MESSLSNWKWNSSEGKGAGDLCSKAAEAQALQTGQHIPCQAHNPSAGEHSTQEKTHQKLKETWNPNLLPQQVHHLQEALLLFLQRVQLCGGKLFVTCVGQRWAVRVSASAATSSACCLAKTRRKWKSQMTWTRRGNLPITLDRV